MLKFLYMKKLNDNKTAAGLLLFGALVIGGLSLQNDAMVQNNMASVASSSVTSKTFAQKLFTPKATVPAAVSKVSPAWKNYRLNNTTFTEIPTASLQGVVNFCNELRNKLPTNFITKIGNVTYEGVNDGKLYCISTGEMCGNGSPGGCRDSGCCNTGCVGGVAPLNWSNPPTMADLLSVPGLFFVPNTIINGIKDNPNM